MHSQISIRLEGDASNLYFLICINAFKFFHHLYIEAGKEDFGNTIKVKTHKF